MKQLYRYFVCISLLALALPGFGQEDIIEVEGDTVLSQNFDAVDGAPDSLRLRINGLRIGLDLKSWIQGVASSERDVYNVHLRLDAGPGAYVRYGALLDYTRTEANIIGDSATYQSMGNIGRLGLYLNVIPDDPDHNLVTIGINYGRSWFSESLQGIVRDEVYGDFPVQRSTNALKAGWFEISGGMQARIWKQLYTGYNLTLKLLPHFKDDEQVRIYEIPGYGSGNEKSTFGFSYYLLYRFSR